MRTFRAWVCVLVLALIAAPAWGARAQLALDARRLATGQAAQLSVYVVDGRPAQPPVLSVPDGLEIAYRGSRQTFQSNGLSITRLFAYEYQIRALREGRFVLGPYALQLDDGTTVETNELAVEVISRSELPGGEGIQAEATFDVEQAWEGQLVHYRYLVRARARVAHVGWRLPDFEGLRIPQQGQPSERTYVVGDPDGDIAVSEGVIPLIATATGDREQPPALAKVELHVGRRNVLGFSQTRSELVPTQGATLRVLPLPTAPPDFSGLVGEFAFESTLEKSTAAVGESVSWVVEAAGTGSLEGFSLPASTGVEGARVYESDVEISAQLHEGAYLGVARVHRVLVPTEEGALQVAPLRVVTFSPSRGAYVEHRIEVEPIEVRAGREGEAAVESFSDGTAPEEVGDPIDFRANYRWGLGRVPPLGPALPWALAFALAPGLAAAAASSAEWVRDRRQRRARARRTPESARSRLARLPDDREGRLVTLDEVLRLALARHEGVEVHALDRATAIERLPEALRERSARLTRCIDRARFAGAPFDADLIEGVRALVDALEDAS